jgi:PAS domain S-box-containing protein
MWSLGMTDPDREPPGLVGLLRVGGADFPLVEALLDGVVVADTSGSIVYANRAVETLLGWSPEMLCGQPVTVLIPARLRPAHLSAFATFAAGGPGRLIGHPLRLPALTARGDEAPIELLLSSLPRPGGDRLVVATLRDATERFDLERQNHVVEGLLALLAEAPDDPGPRLVEVIAESLECDAGVLWIVGADGITLRCREYWQRQGDDVGPFAAATAASAFTAGFDLPGRVLAGRGPIWITDLGLDPDFCRAHAAETVGLRSGFAFSIRAPTGVIGVLELFTGTRTEPDEALLASTAVIGRRLGDIWLHVEAERERAQLHADLRSTQAAQQDLLRAQHFLLHAARVLAEAGDYAEALNRLAAVAVPVLADLCLIDVAADDGTVVRMAARHADPAKQAVVDELRRAYPPDPNGTHPGVEVIGSGQSRWSSDMSEDFLRATTRDERHLALVRQLGFTSYMSVPLTFGGTVLGALTLVSAGSGRHFEAGDLVLAEELAGHAAAVIDRARRHDREREAAHTLQRSLLPDKLPQLAGIAAAARYLPGSAGAEVGGDWYDVIRLPDGGVGLVIGDVAGHDMGAAAEMGQLRNALRAYAVGHDSPSVVLHELRRFCDLVGIERIATVAYLTLSPVTGQLRVASAGHVPPLVRRLSGTVEILNVESAPPLGIESASPTEVETYLAPGEVVVLVTDGLVERRTADLGAGLDRLSRAVMAAQTEGPEMLCDLIVDALVESGGRGDDIALLVVERLRGQGGLDP